MFTCKAQDSKYFAGIRHHKVSVGTAQLCHWSAKVARDNIYMIGYGCILIILHLLKQATGHIWPTSCSFLTFIKYAAS